MNNVDWGQTLNWALIGGVIGLGIAIVYIVLRTALISLFRLFRPKK